MSDAPPALNLCRNARLSLMGAQSLLFGPSGPANSYNATNYIYMRPLSAKLNQLGLQKARIGEGLAKRRTKGGFSVKVVYAER